MTPTDHVVDALRAHGCNPRRNGTGWLSKCPAHDDRKPSLGAHEGDDGRALVTCHAGCTIVAILDALGLDARDLFADDRHRQSERRILATYDYTDEHGELLLQVVRFTPKDFRQRRPDGNGGWIWNTQGVRRVFYRLPDVLDAVRSELDIFVCEGEKDADAVVVEGETGTTNVMGAGKWRPEYADTLAGASRVFVVTDRDEPGYQHAHQVAASLEGRVGEVIVVEPVEGNDLSDHLAAGHTLEQLVRVEHVRLDDGHEHDDRDERHDVGPDPDILDFVDAPEPEYDWTIPDLLERRDRVIVTGDEGIGKTTHNRQFAVKAASGIHPYTDDDIEPVRSLFVDLENSVAQTRREFRPLLISAGERYVRGLLIPVIEPAGIDLRQRADVNWLRERVERNHPFDILFAGPLYKMAHGDFEEVADAIIEAIDHIRADYGCAVILEAHSPHGSAGGPRPKRPYGLSSFLRWPEFGYHISSQGQLTSWRGPRDADRPWPAVLQRGGAWPWTAATNPRTVTFAQMVEYVTNRGDIPSNREIAKHLGVGETTVRRAITTNESEWKQLREGLK